MKRKWDGAALRLPHRAFFDYQEEQILIYGKDPFRTV